MKRERFQATAVCDKAEKQNRGSFKNFHLMFLERYNKDWNYVFVIAFDCWTLFP